MGTNSQASVDAFFRPNPNAATIAAVVDERASTPAFSVFIAESLQQAIALADRLAEQASRTRDSGGDDDAAVAAAVDLANEARRSADAALVDHALMLFLTHDRSARNVRIPNLMSRTMVADAGATIATTGIPHLGGSTGSSQEDAIGWFREDPLANEHHEHWHLVYVRFDGVNFKVRPRHGELFFYMHQQMLARYDAERLAAGLEKVKPFADYGSAIAAGYDPGGLEIGPTKFLPRAQGMSWNTITLGQDAQGNPITYPVADHELRRDRLLAAIDAGRLEAPGSPAVPLAGEQGSDILGHTDESGQKAVGGPSFRSHYGNHHGFGHVLTAGLSDPARLEGGVMYHPAAAIRDPFFWEWHRHVDDLNFRYQERLPAHDFGEAPAVGFGGGAENGIVLLESAGLKALGRPPAAVGEALFGGASFGGDAVGGTIQVPDGQGGAVDIVYTDVIETEMRRGVFQLETDASADAEPRFSYDYLWHPSYHFAFRIRSTATVRQAVTIRLYLCPAFDIDGVADASLDDRRSWIELDKFEATLDPGQESVVMRADTDSTIVRRPVNSILANPDFVRDLHFGAQGEDHPDAAACECGWPYHLLYPRGTETGMRFALLAIVTSGDRLARQGQCGSMSFCAVTDEYPDLKPMGYPFDRPLSAPLQNLVARTPSMTMRFVTVRHRDARPA